MFDPNPSLHRCRNSRCKAWLKEPVENPRNAFCCAGCESGFYRTHCRVCEQSFEGRNSRKELCGRDKCRNEFLRNKPRFSSAWYPSATLTPKPEKSSTKSTAKTTIKSDRGFAIGRDYDLEVLRGNSRNNANNAKFPGAPKVNLLNPDHNPVAGAVQSRWEPYVAPLPEGVEPDDLAIPAFLKPRVS